MNCITQFPGTTTALSLIQSAEHPLFSQKVVDILCQQICDPSTDWKIWTEGLQPHHLEFLYASNLNSNSNLCITPGSFCPLLSIMEKVQNEVLSFQEGGARLMDWMNRFGHGHEERRQQGLPFTAALNRWLDFNTDNQRVGLEENQSRYLEKLKNASLRYKVVCCFLKNGAKPICNMIETAFECAMPHLGRKLDNIQNTKVVDWEWVPRATQSHHWRLIWEELFNACSLKEWESLNHHFGDFENTVMHDAVVHEGVWELEFMVKKGLSLNAKNKIGLTPLGIAIRENNDTLIKIIKSHGVNQITDDDLSVVGRAKNLLSYKKLNQMPTPSQARFALFQEAEEMSLNYIKDLWEIAIKDGEQLNTLRHAVSPALIEHSKNHPKDNKISWLIKQVPPQMLSEPCLLWRDNKSILDLAIEIDNVVLVEKITVMQREQLNQSIPVKKSVLPRVRL